MTEPDVNLQRDPTPSSAAPDGATLETPKTPDPTPRGLKGNDLRYTEADDVPSWAVGKTADEVLKMTTTLYDTVQRGTPEVVQVAPSYSPSSPQASMPTGIDSNLMYSDPAAYTAQILAEAKRQATADLQSAAGGLTMPMADMARTQAKTYRPEIWSKYGPEIEAVMADVQGPARLNVDLWRKAVNMIAGEHVDEIARIRAEEMLRSGDVGMLPTGGVGGFDGSAPSGMSPIKKLFADNDPSIRPFKEEGLTASDVIAHGVKMGKSEDKYAETLKNHSSRRLQVSA